MEDTPPDRHHFDANVPIQGHAEAEVANLLFCSAAFRSVRLWFPPLDTLGSFLVEVLHDEGAVGGFLFCCWFSPSLFEGVE